jgi:hypothetical protein
MSLDSQTLDPIKAPFKLYSERAIRLATFLGTPLAAGFMVRKNFIELGEENKAGKALAAGIISTVLIFVVLFSLPAAVIDRIPNFIVPLIYMGLTHLAVEKFQGAALREHQNSGGEFYSLWRAAGIGIISVAILIPGIIGYVYYGPQSFDTNAYDQGIAEFQENELKALEINNLISKNDDETTLTFIRNEGIPLWERNIEITKELDQIEGLYAEHLEQNKILREYSELRVETYRLIEKSISEKTDSYNAEIDALNLKIEEVIGRL